MSASWTLDAAAPVVRTLAIPLAARARASELFPELRFSDPDAERVAAKLRFAGWNDLLRDRGSVWGSIVRSQLFDDLVRRFLAAHPAATVVHLGTGLCTRRTRAGRGARRWIEVDLPEVIAAKNELLPADEATERISLDLADTDALEALTRLATAGSSEPVLVIAEGVLMFLDESAHRRALELLSSRLPPGSWVAFDYIHPIILRISRVHPSLKVTRALYGSGFVPADDLGALPGFRSLGVRLFSERYGPRLRILDRVLRRVLTGGSALFDVALLERRPDLPA
jgi:O-methyltransferase involved in polyketide biosynthesis